MHHCLCHNCLSIQMVVNSSILLVLNGLGEVLFVIRLFTGQRLDWMLRLTIKMKPVLVWVLSEQEVLVVQSSFHVNQEHINGSLVFGFNKVLLAHMLNRGVGLHIACDKKNPVQQVTPNSMGDAKPESKFTRQLPFVWLTMWLKPNQVVEFKVTTLTDVGCSSCNFFISGSSIWSPGVSTH